MKQLFGCHEESWLQPHQAPALNLEKKNDVYPSYDSLGKYIFFQLNTVDKTENIFDGSYKKSGGGRSLRL